MNIDNLGIQMGNITALGSQLDTYYDPLGQDLEADSDLSNTEKAQMIGFMQRQESTMMELTRMIANQAITESRLVDDIREIKEGVSANGQSILSLRVAIQYSGDLDVEKHGGGQYTRQVSTSVPAGLIRGLWYEENPNRPQPVPFNTSRSYVTIL